MEHVWDGVLIFGYVVLLIIALYELIHFSRMRKSLDSRETELDDKQEDLEAREEKLAAAQEGGSPKGARRAAQRLLQP